MGCINNCNHRSLSPTFASSVLFLWPSIHNNHMLRRNVRSSHSAPSKVQRLGRGPAQRIGSCPLVCGKGSGIFLADGKYGPYTFCDGCDYKCNQRSKGSDCQACGFDTTGTIAEGLKTMVNGVEGKCVSPSICRLLALRFFCEPGLHLSKNRHSSRFPALPVFMSFVLRASPCSTPRNVSDISALGWYTTIRFSP